MTPTRFVVACSGSDDIATVWRLREQSGAEVITLTLDLGQGTDLRGLRESALAAGAARAHVIDAREEFARAYVLPSLQADALRAGVAPLAQALGDAAIARRLVDVARMEGATAVAFGHRSGRSVQRLHTSIRTLDSGLRLIPPASPLQPVAGWNAPRVEANLWGRSSARDRAGRGPMAGEAFTLTRALRECPIEAAFVEIEFDGGVPVRANGIDLPLLELIESLEIIAGAHGVGRIELTVAGNPTPSEVVEAPAAVVLHQAHRALEDSVLPRELQPLKSQASTVYADLLEAGQWFSPAREAVGAFVASIQQGVTGTVRMELLETRSRPVNVRALNRAENAGREPLSESRTIAEVRRTVVLGADRAG